MQPKLAFFTLLLKPASNFVLTFLLSLFTNNRFFHNKFITFLLVPKQCCSKIKFWYFNFQLWFIQFQWDDFNENSTDWTWWPPPAQVTTPPPRNWSDFNQTEKDAYIRKFYPPKFDQDTALPMTVFYAILFFAGVPGNLLTCFIILLNSYMRAPPNFFLFNLAIVDIITLTIGKFLKNCFLA